MEVPIKEKVDLLLGVNAAAMKAGANFINSMLFLVNEQKYFASTDGSLHRPGRPPHLGRRSPSPRSTRPAGKFRTRDGLSAPDGHGLRVPRRRARRASSSCPAAWSPTASSYDMIEDAIAGRRAGAGEAHRAVGQARQVRPGARSRAPVADHPRDRSAIRSSSTACWATRPTTPAPASPRSTSGDRRTSSTAATRSTCSPTRSQPGSAGRRRLRRRRRQDQALGPGQGRHPGRLPGHPRPGPHPRRGRVARLLLRRLLVAACSSSACPTSRWRRARRSSAPADMIKDVENGIYIVGDGSFSIDQQRYNAQFGGQLFYEIKNGKIAGHARGRGLPDPHARNSGTPARPICDESDYRLGGSFFDGKGQPARCRRSRTAPARRASTASTSSTPRATSADVQETQS